MQIYFKIKNYIVDLIFIVVGTFLMALSIDLFLLPNKLTIGGASGVGTILYYLFNFNISITILIINIPLFVISIIKVGIRFSIKSIVATLFFIYFLQILKYINILKFDGFDMFISSLYGGILLGVGLSLVFKAGASSRWFRYACAYNKEEF